MISDAATDIRKDQIGRRLGITRLTRREHVDLIRFAESALFAERDQPNDPARNALRTDGSAVDAAKLRSALGVGGNRADVMRTIRGPDPVGDSKQDPVPFLILGFDWKRPPHRDVQLRQSAGEKSKVARSALR